MSEKIAVLGLGYVGLPLSVALAEKFDVVGYDIDPNRAAQLAAGDDRTGEIDLDALRHSRAQFSGDPAAMSGATVFIIAAPTPINAAKQPDLSPLERACETVARHIRPGGLVIVESTVYPGVTEEIVGPTIERLSGLRSGRDFHLGYSPERVNPGDKTRRLQTVMKVVSAQDAASLERVSAIYGAIVEAGLYAAPSIKVAEAAKVIENTQRDLNIALINELAIIFNRLGIDTEEVLKAAETKWNFLKFRPGLVGGHCIGVDPYYLTHKAQTIGYHPEIILAGRRLNDGMGRYVAGELVKALLRTKTDLSGARVLLAGLTFKENCPDLRNTLAIDIYRELQDYGLTVDVNDPWADPEDALRLYDAPLTPTVENGAYDAVVLAVAHREFKSLGVEAFRELLKPKGLIYDLKYVFPADAVDLRL